MSVIEMPSTKVNKSALNSQLASAPKVGTEPFPYLGLTQSEVDDRRAHGLGNNVAFKTSRTFGQILRENLFTFFNLVLAILGILLVSFGLAIEALITSGVLLINVVIAAAQEIKSKQKLDDIALLTRPRATVIRQGIEKEVDPDEIVLDDLLSLGPGDQIVVDGTVLSQGRIEVDESLLTGESGLVAKFEGDKVFSGSFCVTGNGVYKATRVGINSFANKLTLEARIYTRQFTPLQREVNLSIRILLVLVFFFAVLLIINNVMHEVPMIESVRQASVLFGLAPSSLFLMIVVAYGVGAVRISGKGALVQQANSVESLCNVNVLCLDKTGTLTTNRINLEEISPHDKGEDNPTEEALRFLLGDFSASTTVKNRTSDAILRACPGTEQTLSDEIPFSSHQGWSALVFSRQEHPGTYVLGAPELVLPRLVDDPDKLEKMESWRSQGRRVLLFAYHSQALKLRDRDDQPRLPKDLKPLCLLNFSDELRPKVQETLKGFVDAGISLKFISGDNPETVAALVEQAGFVEKEQPLSLVSGLELAEMDESLFARTADKANIFGRITPRQKEQLIKALLDQGHYVAMTGDGINDILALKRANLGIAMQSGSEATRNVADIVLLGDSFAVLPEAFQEGQRILNGMQDILRLYMTRILCLAMLIAAIGYASDGFPISPRQNAIVGFITMSIPAFALALWAKPGQSPKASLTRRLAHFVIPAVLSIGIVGFAVYLFSLIQSNDESYARTMLTYFTVICGIILLIFVEPPTKWWAGGDVLSGDWRPTRLAIGLLILFVICVVIPSFREFYGLTLLRQTSHYVIIVLATIIWVFGLRFIWRRRLVERYLNMEHF
ncbi:MAG: HAD-IC family P-type ATPase [Candidatus Promineifilaceae bacterium]